MIPKLIWYKGESMKGMHRDKKVMIVDDNRRDRELVATYLANQNFQMLEAEDGRQALERFSSQTPDVILLDIMMPKMNGYEVCRRLRKLPGGKDVGVVFLTALDGLSSHHKAIESGGDDFLTKPVNLDELIMRVRSLLSIGHLRVEIEESYEMLRSQRDSLLQFQQQQDEMVGFLVHDLKNMLSSQIANADFLARKLEDQSVLQEAACDIREVGRSMKKLVKNVLELGKGEQGQLLILRTNIDVENVLQEFAAQACRQLANENNKETIVVDVENELHAEVDEDLFRRLLANLLDNAIKFSPPGGQIVLKSYRDDEGVTVEVRDDGPGVPSEQREAIFKKYYQADGIRNGSGVGLAFCRIVAVEHDGAIWVEEGDSGGSVFCVHFPDETSQ